MEMYITRLLVHIVFLSNTISVIHSAPKKVAKRKPVKEKLHIKADLFEGSESKDDGKEPYKQLIGNVSVTHKEFVFKADLVIYYDKRETVEANDNINVVGKDKFTAKADHILYDIKSKIAYITDNVECHQKNMIFYTNNIEYHVDKEQLIYRNYGTLTQDNTVLTSVQGIADIKRNIVTFFEDVNYDTKDYILDCQKLIYNRNKDLITFQEDTKITVKKDDSYITTPCVGTYDRKNKKISLEQALYHSRKAIAYGKKVDIDEEKKTSDITGNVEIKTKKNTFICQHAFYDRENKTGYCDGNPLIQHNNGDMLIAADRFEIRNGELPPSKHEVFQFPKDKNDEENGEEEDEEDNGNSKEESNKEPVLIKGIGNIKIYSDSFQGFGTGFTYDSKTSRVVFDNKTFFWSGKTQISGNEVELKIKDKSLSRLDIYKKPFITIKDKTGFYNQINGESLHIGFNENQFDQLFMNKNVESTMFVTSKNKFVGVNNVKCTQMSMEVDEETKEPTKILFLNQSSATFSPKKSVDTSKLLLKGFDWNIKQKPKKKELMLRIRDKSHIPDECLEELEDDIEETVDEQ